MNTGQRLLFGLGLAIAGGASAAEMGTAFTYQGFLEDGGGPVTATCDFEFSLWDADPAGTEDDNSPQSANGVDVVGGVFSVTIDFGSGAFNGDARWLDIMVCCPTTACALESLDPRVELTPAPHAIRAWEGVGPPGALEVDTGNGKVGIGGNPNGAIGSILQVLGGIRSTTNVFSPEFNSIAGGPLVFKTTPTDFMTLDNAGGNLTTTGTITSGDTITVGGTAGAAGVMFPDGTLQTTAAVAGGGGDGHSLDAADGSPVDAVFVDNDGNVGVGTSSPVSPLMVRSVGNADPSSGNGWGDFSVGDGSLHGLAIGVDTSTSLSNCCTPHGGLGCDDSGCVAEICGGGLEECCDTAWDQECANEAQGCTVCSSLTGDVRLWAKGFNSDLIFSDGIDDVMVIRRAAGGVGTVGIGTLVPNQALDVNGWIVASGRIGIGNTSPSALLDIEGAGATTDIHINNTAADGDPTIRFQLNGTTAFSLGVDDSDGDKFKIGTGAPQTDTRLTIDASGNVGIGTSTPGETLDVDGNIHASGTIASGSSITIDGTANTINSTGDLDLQTSGTSRVFLDNSTGNVGIGTSTPLSPLNVGKVSTGAQQGWGDFSISDGTVGLSISVADATAGGGASNCCADNTPAAGCDNATCETTVCTWDSYCCDTEWDVFCANEAVALCAPLCDSEGDVHMWTRFSRLILGTLGYPNQLIITGGGGNGSIILPDDAISSAEILDGTITGTDIADGTITGTDIATASIFAVDLADEPGVANKSINANCGFLGLECCDLSTGSTVVIASRILTAPTSGYIVAIGTIGVFGVHSNGTTTSASFGLSTSTSFTSGAHPLTLPSVLPSANYSQPVTINNLFPVGSGNTTVNFLVRENTGTVKTCDVELTLMFFPTAYGLTTVSGGTNVSGGANDEGNPERRDLEGISTIDPAVDALDLLDDELVMAAGAGRLDLESRTVEALPIDAHAGRTSVELIRRELEELRRIVDSMATFEQRMAAIQQRFDELSAPEGEEE